LDLGWHPIPPEQVVRLSIAKSSPPKRTGGAELVPADDDDIGLHELLAPPYLGSPRAPSDAD